MLRVVVIGNNNALYKEADAAEAITPGHLVALDATGKAIKHNVAGSAKPTRVAVENDFFGKGIDDAYAVDDRVIFQPLDTGCEFMALVAAGAAAIAYNGLVRSAGDGTVQALGANPVTEAIGRATEAVDNSLGGSAVRIRIEVL